MSLSKNDYKILLKLYENNCTTEMRSYSIKKLCEITELSVNKIRSTIKTFMILDYIAEGCVQHNAKTYFITVNGIQKIKTL